MAAQKVLSSDMPPKVSGDQFFATELERLRAALNQHADLLDAGEFAGIAATADHPAFATAREAVTWLLSQPGLREFVAGQAVRAGSLYLTSTGVWAPRYDFTAQAAPTAGANWRLVAGFAGQASSIGAAGITDATDAGRRMLTAPSAAAQRALVNNPGIAEDAYGDHPKFASTDDPQTGLYPWVIRNILTLLAAAPVAQPAVAPLVTGFLPSKGSEGTSVTLTGSRFVAITSVSFNGTPASFQVINATTIQAVVPAGATTGPVSVSTASATGTSAASFTVGVSTTTPTPTPALTAALAISVASIVAGSSLTFEVTAGGGTAPYAYAVKATNNATGTTTVLGSSASGSFTPQAGGTTYNIDATVTDSAGKVAQAITRTVQVAAPQSVNQLPVASAGDDLTITAPTSSAALMGTASDADGDSLTYLWRQITGPQGAGTATGLPATSLNVVASNLAVGTYQFGFQATDSKGGKSTEDFVVLTVNTAAATPVATVFDFTTSSAGFGLSVYDEQKSGYRRRSPFATVDIYTNANTVDYSLVSTNGSPASIYVNGAFAAAPTASGTLTIPGSGYRTVRFIDAPQSKPGDQGEVQGGWFTNLTFPAGSTNSIAAQTTTSKRLLIIGDSILSEGYASDVSGRDGASYLLRAKRGYDVLVDGWGNRSLFYSLGTEALRAAQVQRAQAAGVTELILALGTNDEVLGYATAQQAATIAGQLLDALHSALPNVKLYLFTRTFWGQSTSTAYADAMKALSANRSWLTIIDPVSWYSLNDIHPDDTAKLHPRNAGHFALARYTSDVLDGLPTPGNGLAPLVAGAYTVVNKTVAAPQAGAVFSFDTNYSLPSTDTNISFTAGFERWTSAVFIGNEALVTKSENALLAIYPSCVRSFFQGGYAPMLPDFGIGQFSFDGGSTWVDQNQSGSVRASYFRGYNQLAGGSPTILFRKKPGQDAALYVCFDHIEYQQAYEVTSKVAVAPQSGGGSATATQVVNDSTPALTISAGFERWNSPIFNNGVALVTRDENALISYPVIAAGPFKVYIYGGKGANFCIAQVSTDGGQTWTDFSQNGYAANFVLYGNTPSAPAGATTVAFRKKPGQDPNYYVCFNECDPVLD